jgi:pimeloyl-ACP methyl ester carboxylesterase
MSFSAGRVWVCMEQHVVSRDGTRIVYDRFGDGPPLILVVGAFNERPTGEPLARCLASQFTVYNYDRRGRGASGDTLPYAVAREIEDLSALIEVAGGSAAVFGYSSGANLAIQAAASGAPITALALYEPPFLVTPDPRPHAATLRELICANRRGDAVEYFQRDMVGIPADIVAQLRNAPFRPALEKMAHTLVYEALILGDRSLPAPIDTPTLVMAGDAGSPLMPIAARALSEVLPHARAEILPGQTHDLNQTALAPLVTEFVFGIIS